MRRTLASRRDLNLGPSGEVYRSNRRWIEEGKVTDDDIFPWLRPLQVQGYELTVVGSSPEAVSVCIEAWHAGFKPVLIIMEDQSRGKENKEMRELVSKLIKWHGKVGMFSYGPRTIISEGPRCLVQLDEKGRPTDVSVCTDSGGLHTLAETWELFRGPAIIVDDVATVDEVEAGDKGRSVFLGSMMKQRATVVDPKFWEDRYDPERLSFWVVGYREIAPNLIAGLVMIISNVAMHRYFKHEYFWMYRAAAELALSFPCGTALFNLYGSALGLQLRSDRPTSLSVCFGALFWLVKVVHMPLVFEGFYVSDFTCASSALLCLLVAALLFCKYIKNVQVTKKMLMWYSTVVVGSIGVWVGSMIILLLYLMVLSWNRIAASIFLTVTLSTMETQMVELMKCGYNKFVWEPRTSHPDQASGDQKMALSTCVLVIHGLTETGRLVSMICGAVRAEDTMFLYTNAVAVFLGLVINTAERSGWFGCLMVRYAGPRLRPYVEYLLCPSSVYGLHIDVKFAVGWPRFFLMAGLCVGRGIIHNNWTTTLAGRDPSAWCWNGIVLLTALMAFVGEIVEDWLVYAISNNWPPPQWDCFGSEMVNNFDVPGWDDLYHLSHYIVPQSALSPPSADTTQAPCLKRSSVKSRMSRDTTKFVQDLAPSLSVSPNFKQTRYFSAFQLQHYIGGSVIMILTVMSIGLGSGNLFGFCKPNRLDAIDVVLRNSLLWSKECEAEEFF